MTERKLLPEETETPVEEVVDEKTDEVTTDTKEMPKEAEPEVLTDENDSDKEDDELSDALPEEEKQSDDNLENIENSGNEGVETKQSGLEEVVQDMADSIKQETNNVQDEDEIDAPIQSDKDFVAQPEKVELSKLFEAGVIKPLEKVAGQKNLDDMVIEAIVQSMLSFLYVLKEWAEQKTKNIKEAEKKTKENREKAIQEALKAHKTSYGKMAVYIAIKTDEFLRDNSPLFLDEKGNLLPSTKWSEKQKAAYKKNKARYKIYSQKYKFAKSLDRINDEPNAPFDFTKLSNAKKRQLNFYIHLYATQNPTMRKYIEKMAEVQLHESEYENLGKLVNYVLVQRAAQIKANQPKKIASQPPVYTQQMQNTRVA